jgi:glycosyltransferase involved in cell wall biosynthesis
LEFASWELAAAANRACGWKGVLLSGTLADPQYEDTDILSRIKIPEIGPDHPAKRNIFEQFRAGIRHPAIEISAQYIYEKVNEIIKPGDVLVSFNSFSLPYNIPLTVALWKISEERDDFVHVTWSWDLAIQEEEYDWTFRNQWPWNLFWKVCPGVIYATSTEPVAVAQARALGIDPSKIRVIYGGVDPSRCLRISTRISNVCRDRNLYNAFPLLYMPAKISTRKNLPKAVKVIAELRRSYPTAHLVIAGSLSPHDELTQQKADSLRADIKLEGLENAITVLGFESPFDGSVQYEDTMNMMAVCDGVLFTSRREGFLFPVLEAGLHNVPIFVPSLDSVISWARDYVMLYPESAQPSEIAKILGRVYRNSDTRRKFIFRTSFSWDNVFAKNFASLYA